MLDLDIITQIEEELLVNLNRIDKISWDRKGYVLNENQAVAAVGLYACNIQNHQRVYALLKMLPELTHLALNENDIFDINPIAGFSNLRTLDLSYNSITNVSPLLRLTNLHQLNLAENPIINLPKLRGFANLSILDLRSTQLSNISPLKDLYHLTDLKLSYNKINDISVLKEFTNLTHLKLSFNKINDISALKDLTSLTQLHISQNQITDISALEDLTNLTTLELSGNQISNISSIKNLINLQRLSLEKNFIKEIPPWIIDFNMEITWKENVPVTQSYSYKTESGITIGNNPLSTPPPEIVKSGKSAIKNYFQQLKEQEEDYLFEAKMLIVGEPGAGKTTMARKIENPDIPLPKENETTKGIDVKQYRFPLQKEDFPAYQDFENLDNIGFCLNLWDFGGQEIYKATHRFFLSKRSLYALVADSRNEDTDFNYWLHIVEMFGGESPLMIILNEKHQRKRNLDIDAMRARFTNITDVIAVDFAEDDKTRLRKLTQTIRYRASGLPHIGSQIPAKWTVVRRALENENRNTISLEDYLGICNNSGIRKTQDALLLSQYFHDIGVFLHFQDDDLLRKIIFLNSTWATQAVYIILDHSLLNQNDGRFTKNDAKIIWHENEFEFVRSELLQLMKKFLLTYEIDNAGEYIVPERLPPSQPVYRWPKEGNIFLQFKYDFFMPKGILSQFIVQMNRFITNHSLVWRRGVVLVREDTGAEIIESYDARTIHIKVAGKNRRDFMTIIVDKIDELNMHYEKLKVEKLIPCHCEECRNDGTPFFFEYKDLKRRQEKGKWDVECGKSYQKMSVHNLIDEVLIEDKQSHHDLASARVPEPTISERTNVFVSYSHKDRAWLEKVQTQFKVLDHLGIKINLWDDTKIKSGDKLYAEIKKTLAETKVAILLVSADFLASEFIANDELPSLLNAAENYGMTILPIILKPCLFTQHPRLSNFQSVNDPTEPLSTLSEGEQDQVFVDLAKRIIELVENS